METDLSKWVFAFEELENNLHPALQRRLYEYLRERVRKDGITLFLTTHSPVVIDLFAGDDDAQILHITNDGTEARVKRVFQYDEHCGILDDLDVRASDILQANGIIWVEGPSDRLYMNRWIHLWSNGELQEGLHYQCVFYGGRLLSHLSADDPDEASEREAIEILRVNRNAIVLIDSDRKSADQQINATKRRVVAEIKAIKGLAWVTRGREVEHYLPASAFSAAYGGDRQGPKDIYAELAPYLRGIKPGEGKRFERDKAGFAARMLPHLTRESLAQHLDLAERLDEVCAAIRRWNQLPGTIAADAAGH